MVIQQPIVPLIALHDLCSCAMPSLKPKQLSLLPQYKPHSAFMMIAKNIIGH